MADPVQFISRAAVLPLALIAALTACEGTVILPQGDPVHQGDPAETRPAPATLRRLSAFQYEATVKALFGDSVEVPVTLEPDSALNGFIAIGSSRATVSPRAAELYEEAALLIADRVMTDPALRDEVVPCTPESAVDPACSRQFVTELGLRAWRRPLEPAEVETYAGIADESAMVLGDFYQGLAMATAGLLQSPNFLFRVEVGEVMEDGRRRYSEYEMASRLSYALWNAPPDEELLRAAAAGELTTDAGLEAQALRMVYDTRSRGAVRDFFAQLLRLSGTARLPANPEIFPQMTPTIGAAMRESTLRSVTSYLLDDEQGYRSLFTTREVFVNDELARLYGVEEPAADTWEEIELPADGPRAGLLGHASILAITSHSHASAPTLRGKFVREALLCQTIPAAPPDIGELPEPSPELPTMRQRLEAHRSNPYCASCHKYTDSIGFGLENFDAIGAYRERENGALIDPSGELDEIPFEDARGLGEAIAQHPRVTSCLVRNLYRYATGHVETSGEEPTLSALIQSFDADPNLKMLLVQLVMSDGFRYAGEPE